MCFQGIHSCLSPVEIPDLKPSMPSEFQCYKYPPCLRISRSKNSPLPPEFRKAIRGMVLGIFFLELLNSVSFKQSCKYQAGFIG